MNILFFLVLTCLTFYAAQANEHRYPQEALQCFASSAIQSQKDGAIICPIGTEFCIKEVINATSRADCGTIEGSKYLGRDVWDRKLAQCVYRKCSTKCPTVEEDRQRIFGGDEEIASSSSSLKLLGQLPKPVFNRTSYCCDSNLCNQATDKRVIGYLLLALLLVQCIIAL